MLRKILRDVLITFGLLLLWASTSRDLMSYVSARRTTDTWTWWGAYDWLHGNLSGMSHLDFIGKFKTPEDYSDARPIYNVAGNVALFLQGDSYTRHPKLKNTDFVGVSEFHFINHGSKGEYKLDTAKRNILIIEMSESHIRDYFIDLKMLEEIGDLPSNSEGVSNAHLPGARGAVTASFMPALKVDAFFNRYINQNLEFNLFNYNFLMPIFGSKAAINYYLFSRASGNVVISDDRQFLLYKETTENTGNCSSFSKLKAEETDKIVNNLNCIYDHFMAHGFKEIYLSMIPNTVSLMEPLRYNHLIQVIENDTRLKMKTIDAYSIYRNNPKDYFLPGDTHWNNKGLLLWLKTVNEHAMKHVL